MGYVEMLCLMVEGLITPQDLNTELVLVWLGQLVCVCVSTETTVLSVIVFVKT